MAAKDPAVAVARIKTAKVKQELATAEKKLSVANAVLANTLPQTVRRDEAVTFALAQNTVVEDKVRNAKDELQVVTDLLKDEEAEKAQLQHQLAVLKRSTGGKTGEGAGSAMAHLISQGQQKPRGGSGA
jgi:hypothetical protein